MLHKIQYAKPVIWKPMSELVDHPKDFDRILDIYLQKKRSLYLDGKSRDRILRAYGIGHDGEKQKLFILKDGMIERYIDDRFDFIRLPSETGRVYALLREMGYLLNYYNDRSAKLYQKYITTGISNLKEDKYENESSRTAYNSGASTNAYQ